MTTISPPTALTKPQLQAANQLVRTVLGRLHNDAGVHAETAVATAARMAGTYLLRSFQLPLDQLEAGSAVTSDLISGQGPALIATISETLAELKLPLDPDRVPEQTPAEHLPQLTILQMQLMFGIPYRNTIRKFALSDRDAAFASAVAAARIIYDCAPVLDPHIAFGIATAACSEGAKTVPIKVPGDEPDDVANGAAASKPWYKFW